MGRPVEWGIERGGIHVGGAVADDVCNRSWLPLCSIPADRILAAGEGGPSVETLASYQTRKDNQSVPPALAGLRCGVVAALII